MARTKGSGWGGGTILYQHHEACGKKKAYYDWTDGVYGLPRFRCTACKERFDSDSLVKQKYSYKPSILNP